MQSHGTATIFGCNSHVFVLQEPVHVHRRPAGVRRHSASKMATLGKDHPVVAATRGNIYTKQSKFADALRECEEALCIMSFSVEKFRFVMCVLCKVTFSRSPYQGHLTLKVLMVDALP